jgi:serine/threonine protein kinase
MKSKIKLQFKDQLNISFGIVKGISYLHQLRPKIIHRDLKSANILLTNDKKPILTDFGMAKVKLETQKVTRIAGTSNWMAPEMFDEEGKITEKVDVYAFGMVMYEITTGMIPFDGKTLQQIYALLTKEKRPIIPDYCDPFFKSLIEECWKQDYKERPRIFDICAKLEYKKLDLFGLEEDD